MVQVVDLNQKDDCFVKVAEFSHPYPPTKVMWRPDCPVGASDLIATTGDFLRLWSVGEDNKITDRGHLTTNVSPGLCKSQVILTRDV
jgi:DDB1- and CUL4-associated factor 7